jgi:hypothetical protein
MGLGDLTGLYGIEDRVDDAAGAAGDHRVSNGSSRVNSPRCPGAKRPAVTVPAMAVRSDSGTPGVEDVLE